MPIEPKSKGNNQEEMCAPQHSLCYFDKMEKNLK